MKSMTGYAKVERTIGNTRTYIEIKTLNSKQLDLIVKLPAAYRSRELDIRAMLATLERGKVELIITEDATSATSAFNEALFLDRLKTLQRIAADNGIHADNLVNTIAMMPDTWNSTNSPTELNDETWLQLQQAIADAIAQTDQFRSHEGSVLEQDFIKHVNLIEQKLGLIPQHEAERITTARERIKRMMEEAAVKEVDPNRFEQELIYYLEKLDITEEKVRLQKHIDYFRHTMANESVCGKKLGFVAQEMGREINTTGSKANHVEIQKIVVEMKDELEKIKEQLGNVL